MRDFIFFTFILLLLASCNSNYYKTDFEKVTEEFSLELLEHFPENIKGSYEIKSDFPAGFLYEDYKRCGVQLIVSSEDAQVDCLKKESIQVVKINDENNFVVNRYNTNSTSASGDLSYPIPDFIGLLESESWTNNSTSDSIDIVNDDLVIYIIESKKGKFIDDKYLVNDIEMPKGWEHGFSRGIAINEESSLTIFWLEVW